jgi:glyoxylase-like metal-dependent hydrolase (beta-lactamase superfamily II)
VIVAQRDGIVVIEAPLSEQRSDAVMAKVRELYPGKRITGVINTHAHFDHAGGLRSYVAAGVPVITLKRNADYYARAWAAPHTLNPDRQSKMKRKPAFRTFDTKLSITDDTHPIEVLAIEGSGHNDVFAMVYLPKDRVLVEADAWTPAPPGAQAPAVASPLWVNLDENIRRLNLDVARVAPLHGTVQDNGVLRAAVGAN